jgi:hypothetical protein
MSNLKVGSYYYSDKFTSGTVVRIDKVEAGLATYTYTQCTSYPELVGFSTEILTSYANFKEISELSKALL